MVVPQEASNVTPAVQNMQNQNILRLDTIQNDAVASGKKPPARTRRVSLSTHVRICGMQRTTICNVFHHTVCDTLVAAGHRQSIPNLVTCGGGLRGEAVRH
jgi:hypothetical protein